MCGQGSQSVRLRLYVARFPQCVFVTFSACTAVEPRGRGVVATHGLQNSKFKVGESMQDGVMIAYKSTKVALLDSWPEHLAAPPPHGDQPDGCGAAAAAFRHISTGQVFAVVSLHLRPSADEGPLPIIECETIYP
jgi:hypothetical protein